MKIAIKRAVLAALFSVLTYGIAGATTLITFDTAPNGYTPFSSYSEDGYTFTLHATGWSPHVGDGTYTSGTLNWHDGGDNGNSWISMTRDDGELFNLLSLVSYAPYSQYGSLLSVSASGSTQQLASGSYNLNLLGVSEVIFDDTYAYGVGIDNVLVDAASVPEPSTLILLCAGFAGVAYARRRKQA